MSAFQRPEPCDIPVEAVLIWWRETVQRREAARQERMQRGALSPFAAERDGRMERAITVTLESHRDRTAITCRGAPELSSRGSR